MDLVSFRIENYRSIVDSGWVNLSQDSITGLIGQNESGKTSLLEALYAFDEPDEITEDVLRSDDTYPRISCSFIITSDELESLSKDYNLPGGLIEKISSGGNRINLTREWADLKNQRLILESASLKEFFKTSDGSISENDGEGVSEDSEKEETEKDGESDEKGSEAPDDSDDNVFITEDKFAEVVYQKAPNLEFFEDFDALLPDTIDLEDLQNKKGSVEGYSGAVNLLTISGIDLDIFQSEELRKITKKVDETNKTVTADFREFWHQKIGKSNQISIEFDFKNHSADTEGKAGKPYFIFWINDGSEKLYPKQRSKGVRWFLSFYLQLKASAIKDSKNKTILLIDEPGNSLHARAQEDALKVFEEIKDKIKIIYTTHSPYLISLDKIHRLLAVQRSDEDDDKSETIVLDMHKLGAASTDTLSPLYTLMGVDFSHQDVIQKTNNVILEEISAFYYLMAFKSLVGSSTVMNFLPATGTSNIPPLVNLFLGWGLDFIVVVDDDSSGRSVFNKLKRDLFCDDGAEASKKIMRIPDCNGIEDLFTNSDFKKFVLGDDTLTYTEKNSSFMKSRSKAIPALQFKLKVDNGKISLANFEKETRKNISKIINDIEKML